MLSSSGVPLQSGFQLTLPVADYYTPTGERLDKIGVEPNIKVPATQALEHVLQLLKQ
jgi:C-terminal processing protease CtpA/Prc